jgi:hypothetical protein
VRAMGECVTQCGVGNDQTNKRYWQCIEDKFCHLLAFMSITIETHGERAFP